MQDRIKLNNGKSSKLMCPSDYASLTWEQFRALLIAGTAFVDITANNTVGEGVSQVGTALNKANLVDNTTAEGFGFAVSDDPTINDVLERISNDYIEGTLTAGSTSLTLTDARIKTTSFVDGIFVDAYGVAPKNVTLANGSMTLTFKSYASNIGVKVRLF